VRRIGRGGALIERVEELARRARRRARPAARRPQTVRRQSAFSTAVCRPVTSEKWPIGGSQAAGESN